MSTDTLLVQDEPIQIGSEEIRPIGFDVSHLLASDDTISDVLAELFDISTGHMYVFGIFGGAQISSKVITQAVANLQSDHKYRLTITFTAAESKRLTVALRIDCPY